VENQAGLDSDTILIGRFSCAAHRRVGYFLTVLRGAERRRVKREKPAFPGLGRDGSTLLGG
jgi:hypothetical protein